MVVEVDGPTHDDVSAQILDSQRQRSLEELGLSFFRVKNEDVLNDIGKVLYGISQKVQEIQSIAEKKASASTNNRPPPNPLLLKEGELEKRRPHVTIYTDGACSGNPGPGGYGVVMLDASGRRRELSGGLRNTTNNRMELLAVISGLEALNKPCDVTLISDSEYVINAITKGWLINWQRKGWRKADKKPVMNIDLWQRLLPLLQEHNIEFRWTKGHAGNPENERCDELAVAASQMPNLPLDNRQV
jgi:ribonuclease HI